MDTVTIEAEFRRGDGSLAIDYAVRNEGDKPVYLLNVLWKHDPAGQVIEDPVGAYVSIDEDRHLKIGKLFHPTPRQMLPEMTYVPFARLLQPETAYEESLAIPLPVKEHSPYYDEIEETTWKEVTVDSVRFFTSWLPALEEMTEMETPIEGAVRVHHPLMIKSIQTLASTATRLQIPGLRRRDVFERF